MKNARKILTIVTRLDAKSRLAFRRLQECVSMHPWTMHLAECYRESDGTVMVDRPPFFMHGSLSALIDRLFRSVAGHSILREIHTARIERAKEMLASGKRPDIVAAECGYSSTDDFRRAFRQRMGMTPRKWAFGPACLICL